MYRGFAKGLASGFKVHHIYDEFEDGKLDGVNLQSVPADEAQRTGYKFGRLNARRTAQKKT